MANGDNVTKTMLNEAVDAILNGMSNMVEGLRSEMNIRFDRVDNRLGKVGVELSHVNDEIDGLKADLSATPSRREFEELIKRIDKRYPPLS